MEREAVAEDASLKDDAQLCWRTYQSKAK